MAEKQTFISSCPICGRTLFKGTPDSYIEVGCPKCKEYLKISFHEYGYQVHIAKQTKESNESSRSRTPDNKTI